MRLLFAAAALSLALIPTARAEGIVTCTNFRSGWQAALKKLALSPSGATFAADGENERVGGIAGLEAMLTCRDEAVGHFEMSPTGDAALLEKAVTSVLMGLDKGVNQATASAAARALRAESESRNANAVSSWGPYEFTWRPATATGKPRFILDLAEN